MDKQELLHQAARKYLQLLTEQSKIDPDLLEVIDRNRVLFDDIENGLIIPPHPGRYKWDFHSEDPKYGGHTKLFSAQAELISALEDWRSKPWYVE